MQLGRCSERARIDANERACRTNGGCHVAAWRCERVAEALRTPLSRWLLPRFAFLNSRSTGTSSRFQVHQFGRVIELVGSSKSRQLVGNLIARIGRMTSDPLPLNWTR
jgi:hypothetical protein